MDVVTLGDQMLRVARFYCEFFTSVAGNKAGNKNQGSSLYFYAEVQFVLFTDCTKHALMGDLIHRHTDN